MATPILSIKNLRKYQHYTHRNPPWIKLYREFWTDYTLRSLPLETRFLFLGLSSLAMELENQVPGDPKYLSDRLGFKVTQSAINLLVSSSLVLSNLILSNLEEHVASTPLADCKQDASKKQEEFEVFWSAYPKKIGKKEAWKSWLKAKDKPAIDIVIQAIESAKKTDQWTKENGQFIPHPSTWLNQGRWADQSPIPSNGSVSHAKVPPFPGPEDPIGRSLWRKAYGDPATVR